MVLNWEYPYSIEKAFYPVDNLKKHKYWPPIGRVDNVEGDRVLLQKTKQ